MGIITIDDENERLLYEEIAKRLPKDEENPTWHKIDLKACYKILRTKEGEEVRFIMLAIK